MPNLMSERSDLNSFSTATKAETLRSVFFCSGGHKSCSGRISESQIDGISYIIRTHFRFLMGKIVYFKRKHLHKNEEYLSDRIFVYVVFWVKKWRKFKAIKTLNTCTKNAIVERFFFLLENITNTTIRFR